LDLLAYQIEEITAADLQIGEDEQLEQERSRLANLDRIRQAVQYAVTMLGESCGDGEPVLSLLSLVEAELDRAAALDAPLEPLSQRYAELVINLQELYRDLRDHLENLPADPGRLNEVEERLELLDRLKRKYGNTVEEIIGYRERVEAELTALQQAEVRAAGLDEECQRLAQQWLGLAEQLSRSRLDLAQRLEEQIGVELSDLAMDGTRFRVQFLPQPGDHPVLGGRERVEFMLAANVGEELKPLAKVASGGELSRVLLALKAILARAEQIPTVVFDEVDAGIGGRTAVKLGEKLRALGEVRQVLCVTHLPVVASFGTHHYSVQKFTQEGRTAVRAALLAPEERVLELTRMLGGSADEQVASEHARELLRRTEAAAGKLELGS
jgi:DNA repair protein RecN (Recombination protein N)